MDLDAIEQRANAATEGPWEYDGRTLWGRDDIGRIKADTPEDRVFTAAARTDVPDLVARVRELEEESQRMRKAVERVHAPYRLAPGMPVCRECQTGYDGDAVPYPCPTIKAMSRAPDIAKEES